MASQPSVEPTPLPTLLLCGGGTGGHVYPALAVAEALVQGSGVEGQGSGQQRPEQGPGSGQQGSGVRGQGSETEARPGAVQPESVERLSPSSVFRPPSVIYVGSADGMEAGLVRKESDLPFRAISAAAVRGRSPLALARNSLILARGTIEARRLLRELRPAAILGTGGYVCVPLFVAARTLGIPTAIYLPDVVPGLAVRMLARIATVVACNVEDSLRYFGRRMINGRRLPKYAAPSTVQRRSSTVVTGYPVRAELFTQDKAACRRAFGLRDDLPVVVVYGGSRGARSINQAIGALLTHLLPLAQVIHVCGREGDEHFLREAAAKLPAELQERYKLFPYLFSSGGKETLNQEPVTLSPGHLVTPSMTAAFGAADLAICRSGASTMAELPAAGLPAVLVPYPFVHQDENADYLLARGAAIKVGDAEMLGSGLPEHGPLFQQVQRLLLASHERSHMSERSRALARPDAARDLAALLLALATSTRIER